jgi:hypothetical protein
MKIVYSFLLFFLFSVIIVDAVPGRFRDFFTRKPNLNSSTPKIAKKASPDARVVKLETETDHKNFQSTINYVKNDAERGAKYHHDTYDPHLAIPLERTRAYMKHNLKVLNKTPVGGKIAISRSQSQNNEVYHRVKE